jgi:site-specific recombinase XerC
MNCEHLGMRDGRWVFLDFLGKGNKTRSVAVPLWVKQEIDGWLDVAAIEKGPIFRRVFANGRVGKDALTERAVWQLVREYAAQIGSGSWRRMIFGARRRSYAARRAGNWNKFSFCSGMNRF